MSRAAEARRPRSQARAVAVAVAAADAAVAAGQRFALLTLDTGMDAKAPAEAFAAIQAKHAALAVITFSPDAGAPRPPAPDRLGFQP